VGVGEVWGKGKCDVECEGDKEGDDEAYYGWVRVIRLS
jgi:hypothetical protein